jgi:hypothetical protein|tara:strand:+ start:134 stop:409 length:276 start_codon:yes stop_codon:yes gene_type:complete
MKIKPEQIDRLIGRLMKSYREKDLILLKTDEAAVETKIRIIIAQNFHEEEAIEEEARAMLDSHARETREMDMRKMFLLTKQRLAEKKGFVL